MVEGIYQSKVNSLLSQIRAHQEKADLVAQDAPSSSLSLLRGKRVLELRGKCGSLSERKPNGFC